MKAICFRSPKASWNYEASGWIQQRMSEPCPYAGFEMLLMPYVKNWKVFLCPSQDIVRFNGSWRKFRPLSDPDLKGCISYGYSEAIVYPAESTGLTSDRRSFTDFPAPSRTIMLAENDRGCTIRGTARERASTAAQLPSTTWKRNGTSTCRSTSSATGMPGL